MVLLIGGRASGKYEAAQRLLGGEPRGCTAEEALSAPAVRHMEAILRQLSDAGEDTDAYIRSFIRQNPGAVVLCDEVGCGIVPLNYSDRRYREAVGRACCLMQAASHTVYRVVCGIPIKIKGTEETP